MGHDPRDPDHLDGEILDGSYIGVVIHRLHDAEHLDAGNTMVMHIEGYATLVQLRPYAYAC